MAEMRNAVKKRGKFVKRAMVSIGVITLLAGLTACGSNSKTSGEAASKNDAGDGKKLTAVTQVTNWFAEPEHGGQYAALVKGFYKEAGLDMTIEPGGPKVSAVQIVSSGKAMFGMAQADDILVARKQGIPIVAIAATFQTNPQGLIYHKGQSIKDFSDLNGHTVYTASGASYWEYMKKKYKLSNKVNEMAYTGSLVNFVNDPSVVTQGYITAEPFSLKEQGVETEMLLNAKSGYNPYANVLFTTEKTIQEKPELVKAFVEASVKGWDYYKDHADEINPYIKKKNPDVSLDAMKYGAETQMDLVYGGDATTKGVGYMTKQRWSTLMEQMLDIKLLTKKEEVEKVFTNEFLPKK